jgi:Xaa-Pro aminopeptidase
MNVRIKWLRNQLVSLKLDGMIISNPINVKYLTGLEEEGILLMIRNMQEMGMDFVSIARIAKLSEEDVRRMLE